MAATLVATVGASNANAYDTVANSKTYFDNHVDEATWDALTDDNMARYLILATADIEKEPIDGDKYDTSTTSGVPDQALRFPRVVDYIDSTLTIPVAAKNAMYEQALHRVNTAADNVRQTLQAQGVTSVKIGDVMETYNDSADPSALCAKARQLLVSAGLLRLSAEWA
jgi:hypothetical protein